MNYMEQINQFYVWLAGNPISGNAQALWHRLMAYCNAFGWKDDFTITNARLIEDLNISRQELDRIRNVLVQRERIQYVKGSGNKCGTYTIIPFVSQKKHDPVTQTGHKPDTNRTQVDTQPGPLNKLNETKLNEITDNDNNARAKPPQDETVSRLIMLYAQNNGEVSCTPIVADSIAQEVHMAGAELVEAAITHCAKTGRKPWNYVEKCVHSWHEKGLRTKADVEAYKRKGGGKHEQTGRAGIAWKDTGKSGYGIDFSGERKPRKDIDTSNVF